MMISLLTLVGRPLSMVANTAIDIALFFIAFNVFAEHFQHMDLAIGHLPVTLLLKITTVLNINIYNLENCRSACLHATRTINFVITSSVFDILYYIRFYYSFVYYWHRIFILLFSYFWHRIVLNCLVLNLS